MLLLSNASKAETYTQSLVIEQGYNAQEKSGSETVIETIVNPPPENETAQNQTGAPQNVIINNYNYPYPAYSRDTIYIKAPPYNSYFDIGGYSYRGYSFGGGFFYGSNGKKYYQTPWMPVHKNPPPPPPPPYNPEHCGKGNPPPPPPPPPPSQGHGHSAGVQAFIKYF